MVQIATGHTAGGTVGDYYVYTGDSPFEGDLSAVNFNTGIDFIDVASKLLGLEAFGTDEEWVRLAPISASGTQNLDGGHIVQSGSDFYRFTGEDDTDFAFAALICLRMTTLSNWTFTRVIFLRFRSTPMTKCISPPVTRPVALTSAVSLHRKWRDTLAQHH